MNKLFSFTVIGLVGLTSLSLFAQTSAAGFDPRVLDAATETHAAMVARSFVGQGAPNVFWHCPRPKFQLWRLSNRIISIVCSKPR